jgi:predicted NAD/FAD-dependent oxidoreductase
MAGLTAASDLQQDGHNVLVIDKGRGLGGRLASRRIGQATFDHGAQFITTREPYFAAMMDAMFKMGVVEEWYRKSPDGSEGHPRWRGKPAMTAVPKYLARDLNVLLEKKVVSLERDPEGWIATLDDGEKVFAGAVVLTPPVPQSLALLDTSGVVLPTETRMRLDRLHYECCLAVMVVLDGPTRIPPPGGLALTEGLIAWIADNQMKGISTKPAVTLHATAAFSLERWDRDRNESGRELLQDATPWLGSDVIEFRVHGWRYSKPIRVDESPCMILSQFPPLILAGDAFAAPRVEGAALSGWGAADFLKRINLKMI